MAANFLVLNVRNDNLLILIKNKRNIHTNMKNKTQADIYGHGRKINCYVL